MSSTEPNRPPRTEATRETPSPIAPLPLRVRAKASSVYAAEDGVPGMRSNALGMSPAKIAMADMVMIAAIAGTGSRKNVKGTSSAAARVAVMPGREPMTRPKIADRRTTRRVVGSATRSSALSMSCSISEPLDQAVGQLDQQDLLEQSPQGERGEHAGEDRGEPGSAQRADDRDDQQRHGEREAEHRGEQDVGEDAAHEDRAVDPAPRPVGADVGIEHGDRPEGVLARLPGRRGHCGARDCEGVLDDGLRRRGLGVWCGGRTDGGGWAPGGTNDPVG